MSIEQGNRCRIDSLLVVSRNCPLTANACSTLASTPRGRGESTTIAEHRPSEPSVDEVLGSAEQQIGARVPATGSMVNVISTCGGQR